MALRLRVCSIDEIEDEVLKAFQVEGIAVPVLVTRIEGTIIAGTSMCPHEDVSLCDGEIVDGTIVCPGHGYAFDVGTGGCTHDSRLRWRRYKTALQDGELYVDLV